MLFQTVVQYPSAFFFGWLKHPTFSQYPLNASSECTLMGLNSRARMLVGSSIVLRAIMTDRMPSGQVSSWQCTCLQPWDVSSSFLIDTTSSALPTTPGSTSGVPHAATGPAPRHASLLAAIFFFFFLFVFLLLFLLRFCFVCFIEVQSLRLVWAFLVFFPGIHYKKIV